MKLLLGRDVEFLLDQTNAFVGSTSFPQCFQHRDEAFQAAGVRAICAYIYINGTGFLKTGHGIPLWT